MVDVSNEEIMEFKESIKQLLKPVDEHRTDLNSEEATKTALILPFFRILGYDTSNPSEIKPELSCGKWFNRGKKVDYGIYQDGKLSMIVECKHLSETNLSAHFEQLDYYFHALDPKFAILTNGITYKFYTDIDKTNKMDEFPFLEIDLSNVKESQIEILRMFHKSYFDIDTIWNYAKQQKELRAISSEIENVVKSELTYPSDDLIRYFIGKVNNGNITQECFDILSQLVKNTIGEILNTPKIVTSISQSQSTNVYTSTLKNYSEKDYSRYSVNGEGNYGKCKTPAIVVQTYLQNRGVVTIDELKDIFPNHLQGSHGVVRDELEIREKELHRFNTLIWGNKRIYVSNQWTPTNFQRFMQYVNLNIEGITIKKVK